MRRFARPIVVLFATALIITALVVPAPAGAQARTAARPTVAAAARPAARPAATATYLVRQLRTGNHLVTQGFVNYGGTADLAVALAATGQRRPALRRIVGYLTRHVVAYADPRGATKSFPGPFTGSAGKLAVLAEIIGRNPRNVGGFNLVRVIRTNVCAAATGGQFPTCTARGDFFQVFSTVGQALAVLALRRARVAVPPAALNRLRSLQCANGGFSSTLITGSARCTSDVDTTGYAIQALALVPSAHRAVVRALRFLRRTQRPRGGWNGAAGVNTNSTALAVQGLLAAGAPRRGPAVVRGLRFIARFLNRNGGYGISATSRTSDVLATSQIVPAVALTTLTRLRRRI